MAQTKAKTGLLEGVAATVTPSSGAATCDFSTADIFNITITEATTLTFTNPQLASVKDIVVTGEFAITFPSTVKEVTGNLATAVGVTLIQVLCVDATTPVYYASIGTAAA
tara:strand:+ start:401 stop:730 length:330 start_codon:yes stop_codon:yes gene_type:complete